MWKDLVPDTSLFLVRTCSIFSSLTRLYITPKKKGEGKHSTLQTKPGIIFNRWKTAVTPAQCCDGELLVWQLLSALSDTMRQMEAGCHSPTSHSAGIRERFKPGKSRVRCFQRTFNLQHLKGSSFYVIWTPLTEKWEKREKLIPFFLQMIQNAGVHIFLFFVLSWKFEDSSVHSFSREKSRKGNSHWRCMK